jgi:monoamine oxidase
MSHDMLFPAPNNVGRRGVEIVLNPESEQLVIVIGGGPAGLPASYELVRHRVNTIVLEKSAVGGGLARTERFKDFYFDMGGHRFFTKIN